MVNFRLLSQLAAILTVSSVVSCREPVTQPDYESIRDPQSRFYINPTTGSASDITGTTALVSGSVTGTNVLERGVYVSTSQQSTGTSYPASGSGSGSFTVALTNLAPSTLYYFRAYAKNSRGEVIASLSQTFTTTAGLPSVTTGAVTNISGTGATVAGEVTSTGGATVTARGVCYATTQNPTISGTCVASGSGTGTFSASITGLSAGVTYFVRAYATNSSGTAYGAQASFTTTGASTGSVTDIDGNVYPTVQIGTQVWMAANLKTTRYRNGTTIPNVTNGTTWSGLTTGAWASYDNTTANNTTYGKLYNWYAVADSRNVCPAGWHVPTDAEWTVLSNFLATDVGFKMKSTSGWANNGNGSNASGFNGLPGGLRDFDGSFGSVGWYGFFWSSSESGSDVAWTLVLSDGSRALGRSGANKRYGFSVRCLRD
jgi:uncharacterized protein (TIGR02145 family)